MASRDDYFLEQELAEVEAVCASVAQQLVPDARLRLEYQDTTRRAVAELRDKVARGQLTAQAAALQAQVMRNTAMEAIRARTSPVGLSIARFLKKEGKTMAQLEAKYAAELFRKDFALLAESQRNEVWREILRKAAQPNVTVNHQVRWMGRAGRGLYVLSLCIAVYHIAKAEDRVRAAANEGAALAGGAAGASALGAVGLICGPAAIACVPLGVFAGGILGAMGADHAFDRIWR
jgi:hypothetical protein